MAHTIPDQEHTLAEVHELAQEARLTTTPLDEKIPSQPPTYQSINSGVIAPIYMGKAHEVTPDSYVVHYSITSCANCRTESRSNEFYALSFIKSRINGTRVRHLVRCDSPLFNLPVRVIPVGARRVPFCCECETISLAYLPPPPQESLVTTLAEPTLKGAKPKEPKPTPKKASIDDLI